MQNENENVKIMNVKYRIRYLTRFFLSIPDDRDPEEENVNNNC